MASLRRFMLLAGLNAFSTFRMESEETSLFTKARILQNINPN
jgi:hypothetical protein